MSLLGRFHRSLLKTEVFPSGSHILIAVSGGADSVALLCLLSELATTLNVSLHAAHLDHGLRKCSKADADYVSKLCRDLGIPLTSACKNIGLIVDKIKGNLEDISRDIRREFLVKTALEKNCGRIALGHHADDQVETFLMNLLRGAGPEGLAGMRYSDGLFVRPLLPFRHEDLTEYLRRRGIKWHEDPTNLDVSFTRNRIRHELIPALETYNPKVSEHIYSLCEILRLDQEYWSEQTTKELLKVGVRSKEHYELEIDGLCQFLPAVSHRVIRSAIKEIRGSLKGLTRGHVQDILSLVQKGPPQGELDLPNLWVARRYEKLIIAQSKPDEREYFERNINGPGIYELPDGNILQITITQGQKPKLPDSMEFNAHELPFPFILRHAVPGDRFRPSGMQGSKKLQDFFTDLKLTKEQRSNSLVLTQTGEIFCILGLRRGEGRFPRPGQPVLRLEVKSPK